MSIVRASSLNDSGEQKKKETSLYQKHEPEILFSVANSTNKGNSNRANLVND